MKFSSLTLLTVGLIFVEIAIVSPRILAQTSSPNSAEIKAQNASKWRKMTEDEKSQALNFILNSPLGIAALNQLAIERFISPICAKTFYIDEKSGGFSTLMRVKCSQPRGVSTAVGYDEIRVIFSRFEDNIENFQIERVSKTEGILGTPLPD
ncbi:hypothetical protein [Crocosphaera sp. XPORK-15E]|uniref:hypothetical protein n=1 Tax=Crocosphaera sp. XPORK-15E TaxID=3110247 RepID=UPI002B21FB9F|nr:hypothetical protein [Crocosphaera sp. XPORK-15E]MEA5535028.1 hypothetical protein [Crocosphaera sp. XPORK-15E]